MIKAKKILALVLTLCLTLAFMPNASMEDLYDDASLIPEEIESEVVEDEVSEAGEFDLGDDGEAALEAAEAKPKAMPSLKDQLSQAKAQAEHQPRTHENKQKKGMER